MAEEAEITLDDLKDLVAGLTPAETGGLNNWLNTQKFLAQKLGLELETWMEYVQWAFANPCDYSSLREVREKALGSLGDNLASTDRGEKAAASLGVKKETKLPGGGMGNLLGMVASASKSRTKKK